MQNYKIVLFATATTVCVMWCTQLRENWWTDICNEMVRNRDVKLLPFDVSLRVLRMHLIKVPSRY